MRRLVLTGNGFQIDYDGQTGYIRGDLLTDGSESVDSDTSEDSGDSDSEEYDSQDSGSGEEEQE